MSRQLKTLFTTTSSLEGWTIEQYIGPVSAHAVIGTGLLTDVVSSFTDFFGMRSGMYRDKISEINDEVLAQLDSKARALNSTAVIGLRVDHDEISGGGKSMMMVTAMGTAVRATKREGASGSSSARSGRGFMSADDLAVFKRRKELDASAKAGELRLTEEVWSFLIEHRVAEVAPEILQLVGEHPNNIVYEADQARTRLFKYFQVLSSDEAKPPLYHALAVTPKTAALALTTIEKQHLLDPGMVTALLQTDDEGTRRRALQTLRSNQSVYVPSDVDAYDSLIAAIASLKFQEATTSSKSGKLRGTVEVWTCPRCSGENKAKDSRCSKGKCQADRYGFRPSEVTVEEARQIAERTRGLLFDAFHQR